MFNRLNKGAWSIAGTDRADLLGPNERIECAESAMVWLPVHRAIRAGATTFASAVDPMRPEHVYSMGGVQMMLKLLAELREKCRNLGKTGRPVSIYIETVPGNDASVDERDESTYGNDAASCDARAFMRGVKDSRPVVEYRFFFVVHARDQSFGGPFFATIDDTQKEFEETFGGVGGGDKDKSRKRARDDDDTNTSAAVMSYKIGDDQMQYGRTVLPNALWRHFRSLLVWARTVDAMLGIKSLQRRDVMERAERYRKSPDRNPLNPRYALAPQRYFEHPHEDALPEMQCYDNYFSAGGELTFPRPDCVVRLDDDAMTINGLMRMMLPDYQARCVGTSLNATLGLAPPRLSAATLARKRASDTAPRRAMLHLDAPGDSTAAAMALDAFGAADDDDLDLDPDAGPISRAAPTAEPAGGTSTADINAMLASVPVTNEDGDYELADARVLGRNDYEGDDAFKGEATLTGIDGPERSAYHFVCALGKQLTSLIVASVNVGTTSRAELRRAYTMKQRRLLRLYDDECTSHTSSISMVGRSINGWIELEKREGRGWLGTDDPLLDPQLSYWANAVARRSLRFEHAMHLTTAHGLAVTLSFALLDAYPHELDLHINWMITGRHETSKSFVLDLLEALWILSTTYHITSRSKQATAVDIDVNDAIGFAHETRPEAFKDSKSGGDDNAEAKTKEELGKCLAQREVIYFAANGRREMRRVISQRIQTHVYLSNLIIDDFTAAVRSRMSCVTTEERYRSDKSTAELTNVMRMASARSRARASGFEREMRSTQAIVFHLWKVHGTTALSDITLCVTDTLSQTFIRRLQSRHSIVVEPRTMMRVSRLVRQFVVDRAARLTYSSPASPHYKADFSVQHLSYADQYLYDSEEMFYMAVDMLRHELVSQSRQVMLRVFAHTYIEAPTLARERQNRNEPDQVQVAALRSLFMTPTTEVRPYESFTSTTTNSPAINPLARSAPPRYNGPSSETRASVIAGMLYSQAHMYAYAHVRLSRKDIASALETATAGSDHVLKHDTIVTQLRSLTRETIRGRRYAWNEEARRPLPVVKQADELDLVPGAIQTATAFFVHLDLLERNIDPIDDALAACAGKRVPEARCYIDERHPRLKLLGGVPHEGNRPYLLHTRVLEPRRTGTALTYTRHTETIKRSTLLAFPHMAEQAEIFAITDARTRMTMHIDDESRRTRARDLFVELEGDTVDFGSIDVHERAMRAPNDDPESVAVRARKHVLDVYVNYPDDLLSDAGERERLLRLSEHIVPSQRAQIEAAAAAERAALEPRLPPQPNKRMRKLPQ